MSGLGMVSGFGGALGGLSSSSGGTNWTSLLGGSGGGGGFWSGVAGALGGGSGGSSGNMWGNIFQGMLGGLGAMAGGGNEGLSIQEQVGLQAEQGHTQRRNIGFTADMQDYWQQQNKVRKRAALDTYGQFSLLSKYAPGYKAAPPVDPGVRPSA